MVYHKNKNGKGMGDEQVLCHHYCHYYDKTSHVTGDKQCWFNPLGS